MPNLTERPRQTCLPKHLSWNFKKFYNNLPAQLGAWVCGGASTDLGLSLRALLIFSHALRRRFFNFKILSFWRSNAPLNSLCQTRAPLSESVARMALGPLSTKFWPLTWLRHIIFGHELKDELKKMPTRMLTKWPGRQSQPTRKLHLPKRDPTLLWPLRLT